MKIPVGKSVVGIYVDAWWHAAAQIGMETGVFVEVDLKWDNVGTGQTSRLVFTLNGHEFETLPDLKKAIGLKAFL